MDKNVLKVWLVAIFSITVLWSLCNLGFAVASKMYETDSVIYNCFVFLGASCSLLVYSGKGDLGKETMRSLDTWAYGILLILTYVIIYGLVKYTTATEGALIQCFGVVACSIAGSFFFDRKIGIRQAFGMLLILLGTVMICNGVEQENKATVISLTVLFAIFQSARSIAAEKHNTHSYALQRENKKDKVRVVGYIMFVVSMIFLFSMLFFSIVEFCTKSKVMEFIPHISQFANPANIFIGLIVGCLIMGPIRVIEFVSTNKMKSENYLALGAIAPFSTLFWEWSTSGLTGLSLKQFTLNDFIAGLIILSGGLIIAFSKAKKQIANDVEEFLELSYDIQDVEDGKDIVEKAFNHFNKDLIKTSQELALPEVVVREILESEKSALKKDVLKMVERKYRSNIAIRDSLTGLLNRSGLMLNLRNLIEKNKDFVVFYIDLNKFKPINDNYGHHAGDEALQIVAKRLSVFHKKCRIVSRLGGDEYVVVLEKPGKIDLDVFVRSLNEKIEEYFTLETVNMVVGISASVGYVKSIDYAPCKAEQLLEVADSLMLELKASNSER